jgi:hypothetical protein
MLSIPWNCKWFFSGPQSAMLALRDFVQFIKTIPKRDHHGEEQGRRVSHPIPSHVSLPDLYKMFEFPA